MQKGGASGFHGQAQRRLELFVRVDGEPQRATRLGDGGEVNRAQRGGRPNRSGAERLVPPYRAVTAVVEDDRDHMRSFAHRRFQFRHRHGETAIAGKGHPQSARPGQGRPDRRRQSEPHGPGGRPEECPRPVEAVPPRRPGAEVARVGGDDRFGRQDSSECRNDTAGMDARPVPRLLVDHRCRLEGFPVACIPKAPRLEAGRVKHRIRKHSLRHPQECRHVGSHDDLRSMGQRRGPGLDVHLGPARSGAGDRVAVGGHLAHATAQHEQGVSFVHPGPDTGRRAKAGHAQIQEVVVREDIPTTPRGDHGDLNRLSKANQRVRAAAPEDSGARDYERPLRVQQQMQDLADEGRIRLGGMIDAISGEMLARHTEVQQVFRHRQEHRSRPALHRRRNGLLGQGDNFAGFPRLPRPFHQRLEGSDQVHLLEGLASPNPSSDLAHYCDHGRRIGLGGMEADHQVGCPRRSPGKNQRGPSGELSDRLGHE